MIATHQELEESDTRIFCTSILDRYAARPTNLENMCLAEFSTSYKAVIKFKDDENNEDSDNDDQEESNFDTIHLSGGLGVMKKKLKPAVLRYHKINESLEPERYYYSQILLFVQWRDESSILDKENFQQFYLENIHVIIENKNKL